MTAKEMWPAVGARVDVQFEPLTITCMVLDVKNAYGRVRLQVRPVAGHGSQWVELSRLVLSAPIASQRIPERIG